MLAVLRMPCPARPKPTFDAADDVGQMWFGHPVKHTASPLLTREEAAPTHQHQMFGRHMAGDLTRRGQFAHRVLTLQHELDHAQPVGMRDRAEALGGVTERFAAQVHL